MKDLTRRKGVKEEEKGKSGVEPELSLELVCIILVLREIETMGLMIENSYISLIIIKEDEVVCVIALGLDNSVIEIWSSEKMQWLMIGIRGRHENSERFCQKIN